MWCFSHIRTSKSGPSMRFFLQCLLRNVLRATMACTCSTLQLPKVSRHFLTLLTSKCASRHNGTFFQHLNFQKCTEHVVIWTFWLSNLLRISTSRCGSEHEVLLRFWLRKLLRATTACNCWSFICPDGSAPAALASLLFDPRGPQNVGKTQCLATFLPFRIPWSSFFCLSLLWSSFLFLSSLTLPTCAFHLSISSEVWLLNFPPLKKNIISIFPQAVCPHWGDLPVPESRLVLDRGTLGPWHFPCKFPHKWSLWDVHVRFDCASPRKVCAASFACSWPVAFYL